MSIMNFFMTALPVNADLERHSKRERMLREQISELESIDTRTEFEQSCLETYQGLLDLLLQSKAQVASHIGRRNDA